MLIDSRNIESRSGAQAETDKARNRSSSLLKIFCFISAIILIFSSSAFRRSFVSGDNPANITGQNKEANLVLQVGAFRKETNATVFKEKLSALIDKKVILVVEEGYYKVQLSGFKTIEDIEKIIPALGLIGIKDFWIPPDRNDSSVPDSTDLQSDTTQTLPGEMAINPVIPVESDIQVFEDTTSVTNTAFALEIGSFSKKEKARKVQRKIMSRFNHPVEIITQWDRHHVIMSGFTEKSEINRIIPELAKLGYDEILVIRNYDSQK